MTQLLTRPSEAQLLTATGRISWPSEAPLWTLQWEVIDGDSEAIALRDVFFRGKKVLHKASVPMIRVQYDTGQRYKDSLSGANMPGPVKVYEGTNPAFRFLVVESYHVISRYRLTNRWIFRSDGIILPQMYSAGLQHEANHRHHVYWRFDFDIDGAGINLALEHTPNVTTNWGYGLGWKPILGEQANLNTSNNTWAVTKKQAPNPGYMIQRGQFDGQADGFSPWDGAVVTYRAPEDLKGRLGTATDDQLYQHVTGENVDGTDVVFWYIAHLAHLASEGPDHWHVCGPILRPFRY